MPLVVPTAFLSYHLQRRIMVYLTTQQSPSRFIQCSPIEPSLRARTNQVLCAHLQPEGCRSAEYLALQTERERLGHCHAGRHHLHEPCHVGYHWFGRLERVRRKPCILSSNRLRFVQVSTTSLIHFSSRRTNWVRPLRPSSP